MSTLNIMGSLSKVVATMFSIASTVDGTELSTFALTDTGSIDGGNTFPGVARPLGIVKLGPDVFALGTDAYSGYLPDGSFTGFTMLHESGTGGAPKYGVVSQMPVVGSIDNPLSGDRTNDTRAEDDFTEVGLYRASLSSGVVLEMAASSKAGIYSYTFPEDEEYKQVLVDVSHVLSSYRGQRLEQHFLGGNISIHGQKEDLHYTGFGTYDNGWNRAEPWTVYFCGNFDQAASAETFLGEDFVTDDLVSYPGPSSIESDTGRLGALFSFDASSVESRVGVSFISASQACDNLEAEMPRSKTLQEARRETRDAWNSEVFSKVTTSERNETKLQQLYSALYFMHLLPTNKTGENPKWESDEPYYDDVFTFWDIYRSSTPLLHILQPVYYEEFLRAMIDIWRHDGWVSDARSSFSNGAVQGGTNGDNVFADAYVKGVRGQIDWEDAFASMVRNAEEVPEPNHDPRDSTGSTKEGRGALPDWLEYGYITRNFSRSVSRAVEYSVNDFSLASVALGLNKTEAFDRYLSRSLNWRNHWNENLTALGFTGFLGPRDKYTGLLVDQDPLSCGGCYWGDDYYQALPWEYSLNAHHDVAHLVSLCGGADEFVARLEKTFEEGVSTGNSDFGYTLFNPGNQPSFVTPYLYNFVNRQDLSVKRSRHVAKSYYVAAPDGLPGNSDSGSMEAWFLWSLIGLYPVTGQSTFLIGSPWFSDLTISLGGGGRREVVITAKGEDGRRVADEEADFYVQSLKVNGMQWDRSWLSWGDLFASGGTLEFVLGPEPKQWTTGDLPPSPGSGTLQEARETLQSMQGRSTER